MELYKQTIFLKNVPLSNQIAIQYIFIQKKKRSAQIYDLDASPLM